MYQPAAFEVVDEASITEMLRQMSFGCLVTHGPEGLFASHLPFDHNAGAGRLVGHVARANPHWSLSAEGEALVIFQGANAYVSPNLYPSKAEHGRVVPTWNYEAVHVYGQVIWRDDPAWLRSAVSSLTNRFEAGRARPWSIHDAPDDHIERQLRGIVGIELQISRIEAKRKLSQNRTDADRNAVQVGLAASQYPADVAVAKAMLRR